MSGSAASVLGDSAGAAGTAAGNAGSSGAASGAGASSGTGATGGTGSGSATPSWRDTLPEGIRGDQTLSKYSNVETLAQAHINLQKMVGSDKIAIPGKNSSEADWQNVFKKLGLPESVDKYEMKAPEAIKDEKFLSAFKEQALKAGVLPSQAEKLLNWSVENSVASQKAMADQREQAQAKAIDGLKAEWGEGWDRKVGAAKAGVEWAGGEDLRQYLAKTGLGNDPVVIKMMAKVGEALTEGKVRGEGAGMSGGLTPDEAQKKINSVLSDASSPYHNRNHADHGRAIEEMNRLFTQVYGVGKK